MADTASAGTSLKIGDGAANSIGISMSGSFASLAYSATNSHASGSGFRSILSTAGATGFGFLATSKSGIASYVTREEANSNSTWANTETTSIVQSTAGTAADGFGGHNAYYVEDDSGASVHMGTLGFSLDTVATAASVGRMSVGVKGVSGATTENAAFVGTNAAGNKENQFTGDQVLTQYGVGNKEAADLTKTESIYVPVIATDGTVLEKVAGVKNFSAETATTTAILTWTPGVETIHLTPVGTVSINGLDGTGAVNGTRVTIVQMGGTSTIANFMYNVAGTAAGSRFFDPSGATIPVTTYGGVMVEYVESIDSGNGGWVILQKN